MFSYNFAAAALVVFSQINLCAQLAITEAMPSASTNNTQATIFGQGPDFWELTNFGTNTMDLTGYRFNDAEATLGGDANSSLFSGVSIGPGESIIFVQTTDGNGVTNRDDFFLWWGAANLPTNLQVLFYAGNGQSSLGDSLVLWDNLATSDADFLDRADYGEANRGRSFTYNTTNAAFGVTSSSGVDGAFTAATSDDQGSPGVAQGPVALTFTAQPTNLTGYVGFPVTLHAAARGLPRPRYQWQFNNAPIDGAAASSLTITNVQTTNAGVYSVVITNGLEALLSSNAILTVDVAPALPSFVTPPKSIDAYEGQTVTLTALAQGNPTPAFQWRSNGVDLVGESANLLVLPNVQTNYSATYSAVVANIVGSNTASAVVTITPKPRLLITETHSTGSSAVGGQDWWELTNLGAFPVKLRGCRFDDNSQSLASAITFTNDITINPGEAIVLVENISPSQFRSWWSPTNVPESVKILSYGGAGVGLGSGGDALYLWNAAATSSGDFICGLTFGTAVTDVVRRSFVQDPDNPIAQSPFSGSLAIGATNGVNGAFSATTGDVGSPGRYIAPLILTVVPGAGGVAISWDSAPGRSYAIDFKTSAIDATWTTLTNITAAGSSTTIADPSAGTTRLYRGRAILPVP